MEVAAKSNYMAMGGFFFAEKHLEARSLVSPISKAIVMISRLWLICAKGREDSDEILWLRETLHASAEMIRERVNGY